MKVIINKKELSIVLANAKTIASKKSNLSITNSVLIEAHDGVVRISATNLDQTYQCDLVAEVETSGKAVLPCIGFENGKKTGGGLYEIVSNYPDAEITIDEIESRWYRIGSKTGPEYNVVGGNPDNFPEIPSKYGQSIELDGKVFSEIVQKTCFIQGDSDEKRPHIKGVLFDGNENQLMICSTDGSMVSRLIMPEISDFSGKYLVTKIGLSSISVGEKISVSFSESTAFFETNGGMWGIRLLEGDFPAVEGVCDLKNPPIKFDAHLIFDTLKRAKIQNTEEYKSVKLAFADNKLTAEVINPESGEYSETLDIDTNSDVVLAVDTKRLYSIVNATNEDSIMEVHGEKKPVIVRDGAFTFAVMPMSL